MKFCQKCGKELFDEAVICPGCGCPVECSHSKEEDTFVDKINAVLILNIVAVIISFLSGFAYSGLQAGSWSEVLSEFFSDPLVYRLFVLVCISFVVSLLIKLVSSKMKLFRIVRWLYFFAILATIAYFFIYSPIYFLIFIGGSGIFMGVAPILQIIAARKLMRIKK